MIHDVLVWIVSHSVVIAKAFLLGMIIAFAMGIPEIIEEFRQRW